MRWRSSRCPSLGCSALGAEQERMDEEWNDLSQIVLPPLGSDLTPYISREVMYMVVWGVEPMVYMRRSLGGSYSGALWTMAMSWSQRSLGHHPATLF